MKDKTMRILLRTEDVGMVILGCYIFSLTGYSWWLFVIMLVLPDIGMAGYLLNSSVGSAVYNVFHHKGLAAVIIVCGFFFMESLLTLTGSVLLTHAAIDRIFGFGLKYKDSFKHTHLGWIGNKEEKS